MAIFTSPSTWGRSKSSSNANGRGHSHAPPPSSSPLSNGSSPSNPYASNFPKSSSSALHPYATMPPPPQPVVASHDATDDEEDCPVCLESLSFSFRLPGEKPHIVPECGHALHEACFTAVYGPVPTSNRIAGGIPRKSNLGVCGVCRRPMKVGDGDGGKSNKLAALTGMSPSGDSPYSSSSRPGVVVGNSNRPPMAPQPAVVLGGLGVVYVPGSSASSSAGKSSTPLVEAHPSNTSYVGPTSAPKPYDPNEDDPLEHNPSIRSGSSDPHNQNSGYVVAPSIQVRSEFASITPNSSPNTPGVASGTQPLTCIVVVELASRKTTPSATPVSAPLLEPYPMAPAQPSLASHRPGTIPEEGSIDQEFHDRRDHYQGHYPRQQAPYRHQSEASIPPHSMGGPPNALPPPPPESDITPTNSMVPSAGTFTPSFVPSPALQAAAEDLQMRIQDWKGHPMSGLGPLQMLDILSVRRDALVREFFVYLFKEAIICVLEEKKKGPGGNSIGRLLSAGSTGTNGSITSSFGDGYNSPAVPKPGVLRLKGRIYIRHIKKVHDTSVAGELSLTIDMEDERLESFILIFNDVKTLETWRSTIQNLVNSLRDAAITTTGLGGGVRKLGLVAPSSTIATTGRRSPVPGGGPSPGKGALGLGDMDEFGGNAKAARMLSGSTGTVSTSGGNADSLLDGRNGHGGHGHGYGHHGGPTHISNGGPSGGDPMAQRRGYQRSTVSSAATSSYSMDDKDPYLPPNSIPNMARYHQQPMHAPSLAPTMSPTPVPHATSSAPSNNLPPIPHTPLDLVIVLSLPPPSAAPSTAALKLRVIKATLDFIVTNLGSRDRLSLVTFEVGNAGKVRKTPFLRIGRALGRERLIRFINTMTFGGADSFREGDNSSSATLQAQPEDEFAIRVGKDEKTDVVTGVNNALDSVLQRKAKNPVSGMLLVSDAADSIRKAQMDLVLARAEAANIPIHSFGYGRSHDPAVLWLMSNHTSGTYTFVKDWYDLRSCLAGCIGGMMSIGIINMKLHLKIVDQPRFRVRKVSGGPHAILSSEGKDVDIDIGEVRYGERKEMLVELELTTWPRRQRMENGHGNREQNATDRFVQSLGLDTLSIGGDASPNLVDGMMDGMIDEVPVFEVDGSFYDPAASKHVSRLVYPVLLTVTLLPPPISTPSQTPPPTSDPVIVRRRMELLASEMITRALVLISRKNYEQPPRIMSETKRILHTVLQNVGSSLSAPGGGSGRNRKELLTLATIRSLQCVLQDIQGLIEAMEDNIEMFAHDHRNFGAQQAMILRDQKSWTGRTATEKMFWTADSSVDLVQRSTDWVSHRD